MKRGIVKEFLMPTVWKVTLTVIFVLVYFALSQLCLPAYVDTFDPLNQGPGIIYACGELLSNLAESVFVSLQYPFAWILVITIVYIISSTIIYLANKKQ